MLVAASGNHLLPHDKRYPLNYKKTTREPRGEPSLLGGANPVRHSLAGIPIGSMPDGEGIVCGIQRAPQPAES
jgi:hypothetical protein